MSLGIAVIENSNVFLMADTQLSFPENSGKKPLFGLKVFFLDKHTAIAYSGTAGEAAHSRLYAIYKQGDLGDLINLAEQIHSSFDQEVDFLLTKTGKMPSIVKISSGKISIQSAKGIYWIGDGDAARFVANTTTHNADQLEKGLRLAIEDSRFSTVGGHAVIARGGIEGFRFIPYMNLVSPNYFVKEDWQTVNFGTSQTGGFAYTTIVPTEAGTNGWGVFYFQGLFGKYWHVDLESNACEVLVAHAQNVEDFIKLIQHETGTKLGFCGSLG